jgi:hypothetical protein
MTFCNDLGGMRLCKITAADPPVAEGERGVLSQLGLGQQSIQVKPGGRLM